MSQHDMIRGRVMRELLLFIAAIPVAALAIIKISMWIASPTIPPGLQPANQTEVLDGANMSFNLGKQHFICREVK